MEKQEIHGNDIQNLLNQVSEIRNKYDRVAEITGENFNIFRILGVQDRETRMHSKFINELLNIKGSHSQKDKYLKLFLDELKIIDFDTLSSKSQIEFYIGPINKEYTKGGLIDILIQEKNGKRIIIENKIYAGDQKNQLLRYYNFDSNAKIFYLNLSGDNPSDWSTNENELSPEKYSIISYEIQIINWLNKCLEQSALLPIIRESITQYINQLNFYFGKTNNHIMEADIVKLLSKDENIHSTFDIWSSLDKVKRNLMDSFIESKNIEKIKKELSGYDFDDIQFQKTFGERHSIVTFSKKDSIHNLKIQMMDWYWDCVIGIQIKDNTNILDYCGYDYKEYVLKVRECLSVLKFGKIENWDSWVWNSRNKRLFELANNSNAWINLKSDDTIINIATDIKLIMDNLKEARLEL